MAYADPNDFEPLSTGDTAIADPNDFEPIAQQQAPKDLLAGASRSQEYPASRLGDTPVSQTGQAATINLNTGEYHVEPDPIFPGTEQPSARASAVAQAAQTPAELLASQAINPLGSAGAQLAGITTVAAAGNPLFPWLSIPEPVRLTIPTSAKTVSGHAEGDVAGFPTNVSEQAPFTLGDLSNPQSPEAWQRHDIYKAMGLPEQYTPLNVHGELGNTTAAASYALAAEKTRRFFTPIIGPSEGQRAEDSIDWGKDEQGNPVRLYKPLGNRWEQEGGLISTPVVRTEDLMVKPSANDSTLTAALKATWNVAAGTLNTFTSPLGAATALTGNEFPALARGVSAAFAADMLSGAKESAGRAFTGRTPQEQIEGALGAIVGVAFAAGAIKHAAGIEAHPVNTRDIINNVSVVPDHILQIAGADADFQKSSPDLHAAITAELARRNLQPVSAEDLVQSQRLNEAGAPAVANEILRQQQTQETPKNEQAAEQSSQPSSSATTVRPGEGRVSDGIHPAESGAGDNQQRGAAEPAPVNTAEPAVATREPATEQAIETVERIGNLAKGRKSEWVRKNPTFETVAPDLDFLSPDERAQLHEAKLALPSQGQLAEEARARLRQRVADRKPNKPASEPISPPVAESGASTSITQKPKTEPGGEAAIPITLETASQLNDKTPDEVTASLSNADKAAPEKVVSAVVKTADGKLFFGANHSLASVEAEAANPNLTLHDIADSDSFLTSHGRIIGREEAGKIGHASTSQRLIPQEPPRTETQIKDHPVVEVPVDDITLSKDVPQFKEGANDAGETEPLQGKYNRLGTGAITVWERLDGSKEVITGRNRLAHARRTGEKTIPAQIVREADGFTKEQAITFDAEANIRDGQGSVSDYANYFRNSKITPEEASSRGLLARDKGRKGFSIGRDASDDLYSIYRAGKVTETKAAAIAEAAPGDAAAQQYGIKLALEGEKPDVISEAVKGFIARKNELPPAKQTDFFAGTDLDEQFRAEAQKVAAAKADINARIKVLQAGKKTEIAKSEGIDVSKPESIPERIKTLKGELERWERWREHPDLETQVRGAPEQTVEAPKLAPNEKGTGEMFKGADQPFNLAGETAVDTERVAREKAQSEQVAREAHEKQEREQTDMFGKGSDWTSATEDAPPTAETQKAAIKMKLGARAEKGFVDTSIIGDLADYAHDFFKKGMERAKWITHAIAEFGKGVRALAGKTWDRLTEAYKESRVSGEHGSIFSKAGGLMISGKRALRRKFTELDEATAQRSLRLQKSTDEATRAQKEINREVPDEKRQNAISVWREAGGDVAKLQAWEAAAKGKMFRQAAHDAQNITPKELAIANKAGSAFDVLEKRGNKYDVLGSHRDNYVPHVWDVSKPFTGFGTSKLKDKFKFSKARTFDTFFDGDQAGFTPKTLAIGKLLPAYLHEMNRVIADRQFVQDVHGRAATTGEPLIIPRGRVSETVNAAGDKATLINPGATKLRKDASGNPIDQSKYRQLEGHPALHDWLWEGKDKDGNPIFMRDDLSVHPELAKRINAMMGRSAAKQWYEEPSTGLAVIPKAILKGLDTAQSVMKREMFGFLAPFHQVQEGTHAVGHLVNPFYNIPEIDLRRDVGQQDAVKHGLMLLPEKGSSQSYIEGVGGKGSFPTQLARKFGGKAGKAISDVIDGYQDYLFHRYIPGLKYKTYQHILNRNMSRFTNDLASGKVNEADVKVMSAEQTNAAYGHINYSLLDRNPTMQHVLQIGLLAPDFLEARGRFVGQALKTLAGEKGGIEQLRAIATLAAFQAASAFIITSLTGNQYDPEKPFEVRANNRTYTLRSVPEDLFRLLFSGAQTRREFVSARVNPMAQKIDQLRTGLNYRGEKVGALDTVGESLANYIPITARWVPGVRQLTETGRNNPVSPLEQLAGSVGVKISRYSSITKVHEIANKWMEKQGIPKQEGIYPTSKYQQLRYALEDGDMKRATDEYQKLLKNEKPEKLASGFSESIRHPFTGSKKSDEAFAAQLKGDDKLMYEHAMGVKDSIIQKFHAMPGVSTSPAAVRPAGGRRKAAPKPVSAISGTKHGL